MCQYSQINILKLLVCNKLKHTLIKDLTIIFSKRSITSFSDKFMHRSSRSAWASGISLIVGCVSTWCWINGFSFLTVDFLKLVILSRCKDIHLKISRDQQIKSRDVYYMVVIHTFLNNFSSRGKTQTTWAKGIWLLLTVSKVYYLCQISKSWSFTP